MAYWGQALVLGPNINAPMTPEAEPKALALLQQAIALKGKASERPVSERVARTSLALPIYPELHRDDLEYVAGQISEFFRVV
jgi:dTDP-4-amino-4,6-dideoxygalactose transaminase